MGRLFKALGASATLTCPIPRRIRRMTHARTRRRIACRRHCPRVRHGFFTRRGGVSTGPFASLNCSLSGGDDPDAVLENRARVAARARRRPARCSA